LAQPALPMVNPGTGHWLKSRAAEKMSSAASVSFLFMSNTLILTEFISYEQNTQKFRPIVFLRS